mgnify:CR=1 FL=1
MVVDHEIKTMPVMLGAGLVSTRYGVFENGNLVDLAYEYESAKMIVKSRKDMWADHGE